MQTVRHTFEFTAARLVNGSFAATVIVIYRPGSVAVQSLFFDELSAILDAVATHHERVFLVGDTNIRCDRTNDQITMQFFDVIHSYGFGIQPTDATHSSGGTTDVVITQLDFVSVGQVSVNDVGLSDHCLLSWSVPNVRVTPTTEYVTRRPWRQLDIETLRRDIVRSPLCQRDLWPDDTDALAELYDTQMNAVLDGLIPSRPVVRCPRSSDAWYDYMIVAKLNVS